MDSVGADVSAELILMIIGERFILFVRQTIRILILEAEKIIVKTAFIRIRQILRAKKNIVVFAAFKLADAERRLFPVKSVFAFRITNKEIQNAGGDLLVIVIR